MENNWRNKTIQALEKRDFGNPAEAPTPLTRRCLELVKKPLNEFSAEDLRLMIGQGFSLNHLIPLAFDFLKKDLLTDIEWSKLTHLSELISLDGMLNEVLIEPDSDCSNINVGSFSFVGYELLDQNFGISALTNCGGFDETFLPTDLNDKGLIDDFSKAYDIKRRLFQNNPDEFHADTNVIGVWRHDTIGR